MVLLVVSPQVSAAETAADAQAQFIKALDRVMVALGPESARASATIKTVYRRHMDLLVLDEYEALEGALANGGLVPLPPDPLRFNLKPRVDGRSPIGEKDLDNQASYISARPAGIGALLEIASRVTSGPLEITSMVRHTEYQGALRKTNTNARTSIPMHTMGLAFDIALINTPLETVYEVRDVLRQMQKDGDILFIGERRQLVFHVVPHPSRLGHFSAIYEQAMAAATPGANVVAESALRDAGSGAPRPAVATEVIAVRPTEDHVEEWWAAANVRSDLTIEVLPVLTMPDVDRRSAVGQFAVRCFSLLTGLLRSAWHTIT